VPFSAVGLQNTDRLSGHLALNHPQTSLIGYLLKSINRGNQTARSLKVVPYRSSAQTMRAILAASATATVLE